MTVSEDATDKVHYICQTYVKNKDARGPQTSLKIGKQLQYSTEAEAKSRADREFDLEECIGADAYMVTEDAGSGEVSAPSFIVRLGDVPEAEDF